jgi:hypothetical protein
LGAALFTTTTACVFAARFLSVVEKGCLQAAMSFQLSHAQLNFYGVEDPEAFDQTQAAKFKNKMDAAEENFRAAHNGDIWASGKQRKMLRAMGFDGDPSEVTVCAVDCFPFNI